MRIEYKSKQLQRICEDVGAAVQKYGVRMAELIHQRIDQLNATDSVEMLLQYRIGRCHRLTGDRAGQYSMDLVHPYRLVFEQKDSITITVKILEVVDYH